MPTHLIPGFILITLVFAACSPKPPTYPNAELLLTAEAFQKEAQRPNTLVIDARSSIDAWRTGHIPGSVHFHARRDLEDKNHPVEHFLIGPEEFQSKMQALGLDNDTRVLIYDEGNALGAARLFYALEYFGFEGEISVLNGGFSAWNVTGFPVSSVAEGDSIPPSGTVGTFTSRVQETRQCDLAYVRGVEPGSNRIILDVRSVEEFEGTDVRAARGGHIPGAVNLEWSQVISEGDVPYFKSFADIDSLYTSLGVTRDKEVIPHCHSNVRGSHAYFTLRLMGFDSIKPYEGSWSEFGNAD